MNKKICIITGTRAEYGLLKPLLDELKRDSSFILKIIATCMHLSREFGLTYHDIESDGFVIDEKIEILLSSDTPTGIAKSIGLGMIGFADAYKRLRPDMIMILGDRFEMLAAATTALVHRIPIVHLYGGEVTEGAFDDAFRHSITKMSQLHFTATEAYRQRVIQLGEHPNRVFNVGALGIDNIRKLTALHRSTLEKELGFAFKKHNLLITFHPVTLDNMPSTQQLQNLLIVLDTLKNTQLIFTGANADPEGSAINEMICKYISKNKRKAIFNVSLGQVRYLSIMNHVDAVVGNSSSGIVEAPSLKIGTINIGDRQLGRIQAESIINCKPTVASIANAFRKLYSIDYQKSLCDVDNPYGVGYAAGKIKKILKNQYPINLRKAFYMP